MAFISCYKREKENLSLEGQAWYAGALSVKTAKEQLDQLPVGNILFEFRTCVHFGKSKHYFNKTQYVNSI